MRGAWAGCRVRAGGAAAGRARMYHSAGRGPLIAPAPGVTVGAPGRPGLPAASCTGSSGREDVQHGDTTDRRAPPTRPEPTDQPVIWGFSLRSGVINWCARLSDRHDCRWCAPFTRENDLNWAFIAAGPGDLSKTLTNSSRAFQAHYCARSQ